MNQTIENAEGSAYGRKHGTCDRELTEVGPGTPCGEMLRRYWHPIAVSPEVTARPQKVRVLGEDLILFRDGKGRPGLLEPRCAHRGTSLYYGKVDEHGIRCCYHGWQFDVQGRCIDQPCEPQGGLSRDRIRQPWYPVEEIYGLVFAYMGPPSKKPVLPKWDALESIRPDEELFTCGYTGYGVGADDAVRIIPWSWLQNLDNIMDPFHVPMLHTRHRAVQYTPEAAVLPKVDFEYSDLGISYIANRKTKDGRTVKRVSVALMPYVVLVPDQQLEITGPTTYLRWMVPVDDRSHMLFHCMRIPKGANGKALFLKVSRPQPMGDRTEWSEMTEAQHQEFPTDWEAMASQGEITLHTDEHLATSDRGVVMLRRMLKQQIRVVQDGGDPMGVSFDPAKVNKVGAGNYFLDAEKTTA
jgi:phenylpropionate dioxygenase-like ring-hydroxylating dioxygenase large terminal subunit